MRDATPLVRGEGVAGAPSGEEAYIDLDLWGTARTGRAAVSQPAGAPGDGASGAPGDGAAAGGRAPGPAVPPAADSPVADPPVADPPAADSPVTADAGDPGGQLAAGPAAGDVAPGGKRDVSLPGAARPVFERALLGSRMLALIPVVVLLLATAGAFVYDTALFIHTVADVVHKPFPEDGKAGALLAIIDLFLVGATTLIAALGFYELYIGVSPAVRSRLPPWLVMRDLDDLKARVVSMLILVTAAAFVDAVVNFHGGRDILYFGIAVAVVIGALTAYLRYGTGRHSG